MKQPEEILIECLKPSIYATTVLDYDEKAEYAIISRVGGSIDIFDANSRVRSRDYILVITIYAKTSSRAAALADEIIEKIFDDVLWLPEVAIASVDGLSAIAAFGGKKASSITLNLTLS